MASNCLCPSQPSRIGRIRPVSSPASSHDLGNATLPNGIVKVNLNNGNWSYITNLSLFYLKHPVAYPDPADFEPDGVPYSLIAYNDRLYAVEPNHGQVTETTTDGSTQEVIDLSFSQAHIVPTSILARDNNLYLGNLGQFPIQQTFQRIITLSKNPGTIRSFS